MKKMIALALIIPGMINVNLSSFGQNDSIRELIFKIVSDKNGVYQVKTDGITPLYGTKKKPIHFKKIIGNYQIVKNDTVEIIVDNEGKYHTADIRGKITSKSYKFISKFDKSGYALTEDDNGKNLYLQSNGKPLFARTFDEVKPFHCGLAIVYNEDGDAFFIDTTGNEPASWLKEKFQSIGDIINGCVWVQSFDGKFSLRNLNGERILGDNTFKSIEADPHEPGKFTAKCDSSFVTIIIEKDNTIKMIIAENPKKKKDKKG